MSETETRQHYEYDNRCPQVTLHIYIRHEDHSRSILELVEQVETSIMGGLVVRTHKTTNNVGSNSVARTIDPVTHTQKPLN